MEQLNSVCVDLFVCVEVLRPSQPNGVMSSAVSLPNHMFTEQAVLETVNQYCAHSFTRNWQLPFLNQRKEENDRRKYFMINLHKRMLHYLGGGRTCDLLVSSRTRIQLSHWGLPLLEVTTFGHEKVVNIIHNIIIWGCHKENWARSHLCSQITTVRICLKSGYIFPCCAESVSDQVQGVVEPNELTCTL